jgi:hypothetical protein
MTELDRLTEAAQIAAENYERELAEEKILAAEFTANQLTASAERFGQLKNLLDQKSLLVAAQHKRRLNAQTELDAVQAVESAKVQAEANRRNLDAKRTELNAATAALAAKQDACLRLQREIPGDLARVNVLMGEVAQLQHFGQPAQSQPRWYDDVNRPAKILN